MFILLLNSIRSFFKKRLQTIGLIVIIFIACLVYVSLTLSFNSLEKNYNSYLINQNVEDLYVDVKVDSSKISIKDIDFSLVDTAGKDLIIRWLNNKNSLTYNELEELEIYLNKIKVIQNKQNAILKNMASTYNFIYEYQPSKIVKNSDKDIVCFSYEDSLSINKPYLLKGHLPKNSNEITISSSFAKKNKIKINDSYRLGDKMYKVVGYAYNPVYIYPMISFSNPFFDSAKNNVVYLTNEGFFKIDGITNNGYAIKFKNYKRKYILNSDSNDLMASFLKDKNIILSNESSARFERIVNFKNKIDTDKQIKKYFSYLLLGITIFIILIVLKKRMDEEKQTLGLLKILGFSKFSIILSYLFYPFICLLVGGSLGFIFGHMLQFLIINLYKSNFNIPFNYFYHFSLIKKGIMFLILILVFTFFVLFLLLRKKSLVLLKDKGYLKINILNRFTNKLFSKLPFYRRFKLSIAFRSVIKLIIVSLIFFLTSLLIIFGMGISSLFKKTIDSIYKDMTFKYLVIFNYNVEQNDLYKNTDYLLSLEESIKKIGNKKINEKVYLVGIDEKQNYFKVTDEKLTENDIVINDNLKKRYGLKIGDIVNISITNKIYSFKVKGFTKGSDDYYVYVDRYFLSKVLGYKNKVYNEIYSIDKKYQSMNNLSKEEVTKINTILNLNDLKIGLQKQMASYVSIIYFLAFLSLIVALVIVLTISFSIVGENKVNISLLKVMGYSDKKISYLFLNVYFPFIVISYFLGVKVMEVLLKYILTILADDLKMDLVVSFSSFQIFIGLLFLLFIYNISIWLAKKSLVKVSLTEILKER